jgi:hypothetical protein
MWRESDIQNRKPIPLEGLTTHGVEQHKLIKSRLAQLVERVTSNMIISDHFVHDEVSRSSRLMGIFSSPHPSNQQVK